MRSGTPNKMRLIRAAAGFALFMGAPARAQMNDRTMDGVWERPNAAPGARRNTRGAEYPTGVIGGFLPGIVGAGVARQNSAVRKYIEVDPPVRCWWQREDVWNGYDYIAERVRVCQ